MEIAPSRPLSLEYLPGLLRGVVVTPIPFRLTEIVSPGPQQLLMLLRMPEYPVKKVDRIQRAAAVLDKVVISICLSLS